MWSVIFLTKDQTPASVGISGTCVRTDWAICTNRRFVFDVADGQTGANGANVQIYGWNNGDGQKFWFYTADYGDVTMWVRTA